MKPSEFGERLANSEEACMVADANPSFMSYVDRAYVYRFVNRAYEERTGKGRDEIIGKPVVTLWGEDVFEHLKLNLDRALAGESFSVEYHDRDLGGVTGYVPHQVGDEILGVWVFSQDTRELQHRRHLLVHTEKMATLSRLVAAVLHGLNTPLGALRATLETMTRAVNKLSGPNGGSTREVGMKLTKIMAPGLAALDRTAVVLDDLKRLVRLDQAEVQIVDLNACLTSALSLMEAVLGSRTRVVKTFGEVPHLRCRPADLTQALLALLQFAASRRDEGTDVRLETRCVDAQVLVEISYEAKNLGERGVAHIVQPQLNPHAGELADLTLVVCRDILNRSDGDLMLSEDPDEGGRIRVNLPAT